MFGFFTFLLALILLVAWVFESKATVSYKYPSLFGFFTVIEFIAIPFATMAIIYLMAFEYKQLLPYVGSYQVGLLISVLILGVAFMIKMANKYFTPTGQIENSKKRKE